MKNKSSGEFGDMESIKGRKFYPDQPFPEKMYEQPPVKPSTPESGSDSSKQSGSGSDKSD